MLLVPLLSVLLGASASPAPSEKPKLVVTDLVAQGVTSAEAAGLTDAVVASLAERDLFRVLSTRDVQTILSAERNRQLLGACTEQDKNCAANIGEALGAPFVVTGALTRMGSTYQLTLQTLDTLKGQPLGRSSRLASDLGTLRMLVPYAAAEATGSPLPPPASRVAQYALMSTGAAAVIGGAVLGMQALARQDALNGELCPTGPTPQGCTGTALRPRAFYQDQDRALATQKTISLSLMVGGAALAAVGTWLLPPAEGGPRVAMVWTGTGIAVAGVFP